MSLYEINQVKTITIEALVNCPFPAIKATDDVPLPFVGRTVAYIHALIVDSGTVLQAESPNTEALQNEYMVRQELEKLNPAVMHNQLQRCFETYYEEVLKILAPVDALTWQCTNASSTKDTKRQRPIWSRVSLVMVMARVPLPWLPPLLGPGMRRRRRPRPLHLRERRRGTSCCLKLV
jgi:hypothetical protein